HCSERTTIRENTANVVYGCSPGLGTQSTMTNRFDSSSISNLNDASFAQVLAWRASKNPNGEAARIAGQVPWTAMELWNLAARWADEMRANVARGDIIATNQEAGPQAIALTAAISALGAVEMPLSTDSIQD